MDDFVDDRFAQAMEWIMSDPHFTVEGAYKAFGIETED